MKHFESHNNDSIVTINDTDSCLYLKHRISLKNIPIKDSKEIKDFGKYAYNGDGITYGVQVLPDGRLYLANLYIPVLQRQDNESYVYAMSSTLPIKNIEIAETRNKAHPTRVGKWTNYLQIKFSTDSVENIRKIADSMEVYVFSNKMPKTDKYGMEIYDKNGNVIFNSNLLTMRLALVVHKDYPATFLSKEEYEIGKVKFQGIKKAGLSFTYPLAAIGSDSGFMAHKVSWDGDGVDIITTYGGNAGGVVRQNSITTTQVLICELDGTQNIPAIEIMMI
nr:MAG TPA: hypothetical protein [Caudoviricetes sp.]